MNFNLLKLLKKVINDNHGMKIISTQDVTMDDIEYTISNKNNHYEIISTVSGNWTCRIICVCKFGYTLKQDLGFSIFDKNGKAKPTYIFKDINEEEKYFQYLTERDVPYSFSEILELEECIKLFFPRKKY